MSENTKIEWATHTFNPWEGCQKVGPGCDNCYAESRNARFGGGTAINWGPGAPRRLTSAANWRKPLAWDAAHDAFFAEHGYRQRVFCASLADVFDNAVDPQWRYDLFNLILSTPNLDWLLLTKRIGNASQMIEATLPDSLKSLSADHPLAWPWPHVWIGATIVNQEEADRDIPKLLALPAAKRFLSMEPLLGPVHLVSQFAPNDLHAIDGGPQLDWLIVGGESGPGARPMHPDWARSLRDQCFVTGVPFLFKQWGEWTPGENVERQRGTVDTAFLVDDEWHIYPLNLATDGGHIDDQPDLYRVGKKAAGRFLDGIEHDGFPS
jgi:protein gp37